MRAIGLLAGVGSLLREAQDAGFKLMGNVDTRSPYRLAPQVWNANFTAPMFHTYEDAQADAGMGWFGADLALGHPPCGAHSVLGGVYSKDMPEERRQMLSARRAKRVGLLPLFVEMVNHFQPKIFALDNLPKILKTVAPPEWWQSVLPKYRLTFLTILNYDFGTPQWRERLWVVGCRKPLKAFSFVPPKSRLAGPETIWNAIKDLPLEPWVQDLESMHVHKPAEMYPSGGYQTADRTPRKIDSIWELAQGFLSTPPRENWHYRTNTGRMTHKPGRARMETAHVSRVLSGLEGVYHPITGWPLTPRERARIMDWRDDFQLWDGSPFSGSRLEFDRLVLLTGKAVPSAFPRYLIPQLIKHLKRG
jgi:site-specific DNA-cytosine methylase